MKKFKPFVYQCSYCFDYIWSKWSGHWCSCSCGESYVDQTSHYTRVGGKAEPAGLHSSFETVKLDKDETAELWEETKWKALDKMEARIKRVEKIDLETMEVFIEVELEDCPEKVWWTEMEERWGE